MYEILVLLTGIVLSVMVSINGELSAVYSTFAAAVVIHIVGVIVAGSLCLCKREKKALWSFSPKWIYLGGAIGVLTTLFNNIAAQKITITSIVALGMFGQTLCSVIIDSCGLMGMKKIPFRKGMLLGMILSLAGVLYMIDFSELYSMIAIGISILAGVSVVLSRTVNANLAEKTGALEGAFVNHFVGLPITVLLFFLFDFQSGYTMPVFHVADSWMYLGGALGVLVVVLCNVTVKRLPGFQISISTFVGQIFTGVLIDLLFKNTYSAKSLLGGLMIAMGLITNMIYDKNKERQEGLYIMGMKEKMHTGDLYLPDDAEIVEEQVKCLDMLYDFNQTRPTEMDKRNKLLQQMFAEFGEGSYIEPPFHANFGGKHCHFGEYVYANFNLTCVDDTHIYVGAHTMLGPNVVLASAGHPILPELREQGYQYNYPVRIGENCWLGAGVIVVPGITIGDNVVIGAGSIVTKDIPSNVVAAGNPCRVLREVNEHDREYYFKERKINL